MLTIILLWAAWCLLHSLLLTPRVKSFLCGDKKSVKAVYRLFYNIFAALSLAPLLWYTHNLPQQELFTFTGLRLVLQILLLAYSLVMFFLGTRSYDLDYFSGLRQLREHRSGKTLPPARFHKHGILSRVRHPWYSGGIALLWGMGSITDINCWVKLLLTAYFFIGAHLEEQRLTKEFGDEYIDYCKQVPMFFPGIKKGRNS